MTAEQHDVPGAPASSPVEVLDQRLRVTTTRVWAVFVGVIVLFVAALVWSIFGTAPTEVSGQSMLLPPEGLYEVGIEVEGTAEELLVEEGMNVEQGQPLVRLTGRDGQSFEVKSPTAGEVATLLVKPGLFKTVGTPAVTLIAEDAELIAVVYVPVQEGKVVNLGMKVFVSPSTAPAAQYGSITGTVRYVSSLPVSPERIRLNLGDNGDLVDYLTGGEPVLEIAMTLDSDPSTPSGLAWSSGSGPPFELSPATLGTASIIVSERSPASQIFS